MKAHLQLRITAVVLSTSTAVPLVQGVATMGMAGAITTVAMQNPEVISQVEATKV